ncbi:MAG: hypothetical protein H7146_07750 [Burkholderiaceae bacterium]|nr:hypothetical protein [Microbacteriaceae bacterium]
MGELAKDRKPDKRVIVPVLIIDAIVIALTWRDLNRRTDAQVRGSKPLWRIASVLNMGGSGAYWAFGRKRA